MTRIYIILALSSLLAIGCKNRDVNSHDGPNFSEIHERIHYRFDIIAIDGSEYYILQMDRNNPHEGFGFMALKGTDLKLNQDSIKAYLKMVLDFQIKQSAKQNNLPESTAAAYADELLRYYLIRSKSPYYIQKEKESVK